MAHRPHHPRCLPVPALLALLIATVLAPAARAQPENGAAPRAAPAPAPADDLHAALVRSLATPGWVTLPPRVTDVRYSGPTPAAAAGKPPGPAWFLTADLSDNVAPHADAAAETAFVRSIERAHADAANDPDAPRPDAPRPDDPRLVEGGVVLLVDPRGRTWCVAAHLPHLLRCYDGRAWTFRRADGLPAAEDEPAAFARRAAAGALPKPDYAADGLRDLNDPGRWFPAACADAAGNLHFLAACVSREAAGRAGEGATPGGGVHTLRPDGAWSYFRVYPPEMPRHEMRLDTLQWVVHAAKPPAPKPEPQQPAAQQPAAQQPAAQQPPAQQPVAQKSDSPEPDSPESDSPKPAAAAQPEAAKPQAVGEAPGPHDLVTLAEFQLSDPVAKSHGLGVEPIPPGSDALRRQQWQDHTDRPRPGPVYFLRFDGRDWRFDRSAVGWGMYDMVLRAWPQPDGRVYLANRFGLWEQWPPRLPPRYAERLVADLFELDPATQARAAEALVAMGRAALPALREAAGQASAESTRQRLRDLTAGAEKVARGEEAAVPLVAGRWRFFRAYPQATMPDGRFAFTCERVVDARNNLEMRDCLVTFDPARADGAPGEAQGAPEGGPRDGAGADGPFEIRPIDRGQWNTTDFYDKRANEPPVKSLDGTVLDAAGGLWVPGGYRCAPDGRITRLVPAGLDARLPHFVDPAGRVYFHVNAPNGASLHFLRPGAPAAEPLVENVPPAEREVRIENVRDVFRQPDLPPPWNAWAVQERGGVPASLLRLDGPEPTRLDLPPAIRSVAAVVPLDGGCVVAGTGPAGYWDGEKWDVAPDVKTLARRYAKRFAESLPTRVFSADTSAFRHGHLYEYQLLLASDGRGGLWLAEDTPAGVVVPGDGARPPPPLPPRGGRGGQRDRRLWHFDGENFTDLWSLLPLPPERAEDGAVMTADNGRSLVVQVKPNMNVRPGGYWQIWLVGAEDLRRRPPVPQAAHRPGLMPELLAALGPNTVFTERIWSDREGWLWSPLFFGDGANWMRRRDNRGGMTPIANHAGGGFVQGRTGPVWFVANQARDAATVWADVSPTGDQPKHYARTTWVGAQVPGTGAAARVVIAPDDKVYLLHEGGCSLLRLRKLAPGEKPRLPTRLIAPRPPAAPATPNPASQPAATQPAASQPAASQPAASQPAATQPAATQPAATQPAGGGEATVEWEIEEVARRKWDGPRNDFSRVAFDETGVWLLPANGPLIRAPLPRE